MLVGTYGFLDVSVSITGPGGSFIIAGPDTAAADEAVTITPTEAVNTKQVGADGSVMNSLSAAQDGAITIRLQKQSPVNALLSAMYQFQRLNSSTWALNVITVREVITGDVYVNAGCAFERHAGNTYAKLANILEWPFHVSKMAPSLGPGVVNTL